MRCAKCDFDHPVLNRAVRLLAADHGRRALLSPTGNGLGWGGGTMRLGQVLPRTEFGGAAAVPLRHPGQTRPNRAAPAPRRSVR
jgi:hypothetical protein